MNDIYFTTTVFEWFMHRLNNECSDGAYQITSPNMPHVLEMRKEESKENE